jgi:hypothetical protein
LLGKELVAGVNVHGLCAATEDPFSLLLIAVMPPSFRVAGMRITRQQLLPAVGMNWGTAKLSAFRATRGQELTAFELVFLCST